MTPARLSTWGHTACLLSWSPPPADSAQQLHTVLWLRARGGWRPSASRALEAGGQHASALTGRLADGKQPITRARPPGLQTLLLTVWSKVHLCRC